MRAIVIGGGITGLSVGYELAKKGRQVTIFEREERIGGLAGSFKIGDTWVEKFYHHIFKSDTAVTGWIEELGLGDRLVWRASPMGFFHGGRVHRFGTPLELLKFSPLKFRDRVKMGLAVLRFQRMDDWSGLDRITCREWFTKNVSRSVYEVIWEPLLKLKFGDAHDRVPASWIWGRIHPRAKSRSKGGLKEELGYLGGGFELMLERLRGRIEALGGRIIENAPVEYIIQEKGRAMGVVAGGQESFAETVVSTIALPAFLRIAPPLPDDYARRLESIGYQAVICLVMECDRSVSPVYWLNVSDPEITFGGLIEHTNFVSPEHYGGKRIVYVFNYLKESDPRFMLDAEGYLAHHEESLKRINPGFRREWVREKKLFRAQYGTVVYTMGYAAKMPEFATPIKNLFLVNTSQIYPYDRNMNNCAALGQRFATGSNLYS